MSTTPYDAAHEAMARARRRRRQNQQDNVYPLRSASWLNACDLNGRGVPRSNLHNVLVALRNDEDWKDALGFDQMLQACVLRRSGHPLEDIDFERAHEWMQDNQLKGIGLEVVREAIDIVCHDNLFHPLRDWLESLSWDGTLRLADWLHRYLGAPADSYHASIGAWFLTAMVARVMRPGCKADYMLVLEGPQGILKSAAVAVLAGEYYSDALPDLSGDPIRLSMHLRGKWLVEVSELSAFSRAEASRLKAFLTQTTEIYTPKFARSEVRQPRQCVFVATTNDSTYLKDETGGRRFWPARCGKIDLPALRHDREQIIAEAVAAYRNGAQWWPDRDFETTIIAAEQEARLFVDAWQEPVQQYLAGRSRTTLMEVAQGALYIEQSRFTLPEQKRLATVLRAVNWELKRSTGGSRIWAPRH